MSLKSLNQLAGFTRLKKSATLLYFLFFRVALPGGPLERGASSQTGTAAGDDCIDIGKGLMINNNFKCKYETSCCNPASPKEVIFSRTFFTPPAMS
jgi:hypothetical protein